jgi:hypothetical protein
MEYGDLYHDKRNIKRRKYLKYNNKCGYSRKGSPGCSFCHPKRNNNTGIIDFTVYNRINKNTNRNVFINFCMINKDNKNDAINAKIRLLTSSYY